MNNILDHHNTWKSIQYAVQQIYIEVFGECTGSNLYMKQIQESITHTWNWDLVPHHAKSGRGRPCPANSCDASSAGSSSREQPNHWMPDALPTRGCSTCGSGRPLSMPNNTCKKIIPEDFCLLTLHLHARTTDSCSHVFLKTKPLYSIISLVVIY